MNLEILPNESGWLFAKACASRAVGGDCRLMAPAPPDDAGRGCRWRACGRASSLALRVALEPLQEAGYSGARTEAG